MKSESSFLQNGFKWSTESHASLSPQTHRTCVVLCGIGYEELKCGMQLGRGIDRHVWTCLFQQVGLQEVGLWQGYEIQTKVSDAEYQQCHLFLLYQSQWYWVSHSDKTETDDIVDAFCSHGFWHGQSSSVPEFCWFHLYLVPRAFLFKVWNAVGWVKVLTGMCRHVCFCRLGFRRLDCDRVVRPRLKSVILSITLW